MSRTKTNRRTDREQFTRSNVATARPLTLVKAAETLARDWPNTNEQQEKVTSTIQWQSHCWTPFTDQILNGLGLLDMYYLFYRRITLEGWLTNFEQKPLNHSQQLPASHKRLQTESRKTDNDRLATGQPKIWLTVNDCLTVTKDGTKRTNDI